MQIVYVIAKRQKKVKNNNFLFGSDCVCFESKLNLPNRNRSSSSIFKMSKLLLNKQLIRAMMNCRQFHNRALIGKREVNRRCFLKKTILIQILRLIMIFMLFAIGRRLWYKWYIQLYR